MALSKASRALAYCFCSRQSSPSSSKFPADGLSIICVSSACMRERRPNPWKNFHNDVGARAEKAPEKNDVKPVVIGAPAYEVHQRDDLHQKAPGIEEVPQSEHGWPANKQNEVYAEEGQTERYRPGR